jgi:DNA-binding CsgD family transcriptional regulator
VLGGLGHCVTLCAATGRYAEALTMRAALDTLARRQGFTAPPEVADTHEELLCLARQALGPGRARTAEERGAAMSLDTATEYALMLTGDSRPRQRPQGLGQLSARERELITLVAQGRTNVQIAAQLYISVRTVSSHLDRVRDKTGCRRRADLTRLALSEGLV